MITQLTMAQVARLERFADEDPNLKVIGWTPRGPQLRFEDGRVRILSPGGRLLLPPGHPRPNQTWRQSTDDS